MQVKIESFSDLKQTDRGPSAKIVAGGQNYFVNEDPTNLVGKMVDIEVTEKTSAKGNKYKVAKITKVLETAGNGSGNGHIPWEDYATMARAAHELAQQIEPDLPIEDPSRDHYLDRSTARAAIVNTAMINFCQGKLALPKADAEDDTVPW